MITIYGASDDLIEIEGDISEEFPYTDSEDGDVIGLSDGTALRVLFTDGGFWRITPITRGAAALRIEQADEDGDEYSDRATLDGDVRWVVHGRGIASRQATIEEK